MSCTHHLPDEVVSMSLCHWFGHIELDIHLYIDDDDDDDDYDDEDEDDEDGMITIYDVLTISCTRLHQITRFQMT